MRTDFLVDDDAAVRIVGLELWVDPSRAGRPWLPRLPALRQLFHDAPAHVVVAAVAAGVAMVVTSVFGLFAVFVGARGAHGAP